MIAEVSWLGGFNRTLAANLLVAALYFALAELTRALPLQPGYATAFWPASGVAMAGVLLGGFRLLPGVFIAAAAAAQGWGEVDPAAGLAASLPGLLAVLATGIGVTTQSLVGAWLIRRLVGYPNPLTHAAAVLRFILLAGPVSCLVAASIAVPALAWAGLIEWQAFAFTWYTWWLGDAMGVLVILPPLMIWPGREKGTWRRRFALVSVPTVLAFALVMLAFFLVRDAELKRARANFEVQAELLAQALHLELERSAHVPLAIEGAWYGSEEVTAEEFDIFAERPMALHRGVVAMAFARRVPAEMRESYEQRMQRVHGEDFAIAEVDAEGKIIPAGERSVHFPVHYIAAPGKSGYYKAPGFDLASEPLLLEVLQDAALTASTRATRLLAHALDHVPDEDDRAGGRFILVFPIYRSPDLRDQPDQRLEALIGYALAVVEAEPLVASAFGGHEPRDIDVAIMVESGPDEAADVPIFIRQAGRPVEPAQFEQALAAMAAAPGITHERRLEVGGMAWHVRMTPGPALWPLGGTPTAWSLLTVSILLVALLGAFLMLVTGHSAHTEQQVGRRTAELVELNRALRRHIEERIAAERALESARNELEQRVNERTEQLAVANAELKAAAEEQGNINQRLREEMAHREQAEQQARRAERLASVGSLAAGIAHEINNPLASILTVAFLAKTTPSESEHEGAFQSWMEQIIHDTERCAAIVKGMLQFARDTSSGKEPTDLAEVAEQTAQLIGRYVANRGTQLAIEFPPDLPLVWANPPEIEQVLIHLVQNASHARAHHLSLSGQLAARPGFVLLEVRDDGEGMSPQVQARAFDPFYTTAGNDGRTGLGLSICHGIIRDHGGTIQLDSTPGAGTVVRIELPIAANGTSAPSTVAEIDAAPDDA